MTSDYNELAKELLQILTSAHNAERRRHGHEGMRRDDRTDEKCQTDPRYVHEGIHGESFMLYLLRKHGRIAPKEVCSVMGISSARVAAVLNSLESKGLAVRETDADDRRKITIILTPEGEVRADEYIREHVERTAGILRMLGEHDAKEYVRIMGRIAEVFPECREEQYDRTDAK